MIDCISFHDALAREGVGVCAGVPDSLLKQICACISDRSEDGRHLITANEGAAVAFAAGHYLATGEIGVVYMQNSGMGNVVNPLLSLVDEKVYSIPMLLLIGWRGEPGVKDEPQHVKQGEVTPALLDAMGIPHRILPDDTDGACGAVSEMLEMARTLGKPVALVARKGSFGAYDAASLAEVPGDLSMTREEAIGIILDELAEDQVVVSTTGMISREVFEQRELRGEGHERDFLTVGSMGHCSQIALGVAAAGREKRICCLDGDGALIMHMGSLAICGQYRGGNLFHIVLNNGRHDSVGGQPSAGFDIDIPAVAVACGYAAASTARTEAELQAELERLTGHVREGDPPVLLEVKVLPGARKNLGRPTTTPIENRDALMGFLHA